MKSFLFSLFVSLNIFCCFLCNRWKNVQIEKKNRIAINMFRCFMPFTLKASKKKLPHARLTQKCIFNFSPNCSSISALSFSICRSFYVGHSMQAWLGSILAMCVCVAWCYACVCSCFLKTKKKKKNSIEKFIRVRVQMMSCCATSVP